MIGNKGGRPKKFESPEHLKLQIDEYFSMCDSEKRIPTITGLAYFLDTTRKTLLEYEQGNKNSFLKSISGDIKDEYSQIISMAKARIESEYEQLLFNKNTVVGAIFTLKNNFGWVDKQKIERINSIEVILED